MDRNQKYLSRIKTLVSQLSLEYQIVYGGANTGYMQHVAQTVKDSEGYLIGVMPKFLQAKELRFDACDEWIEAENMNTRKEKIIEMSDCYIALPGGVGTYEEVIDILSWMHIGLLQKPLVLYNLDNFYEGLLKQIFRGIDDQMIQHSLLDSFLVSDDDDEILQFLRREKDELYDIYDRNRKPLAKVIKKENINKLNQDSEFYLSTYLVIKNSFNEVLTQNETNKLVGGPVQAFESSREAINRHVLNELGIDITQYDIPLINQLTINSEHQNFYVLDLNQNDLSIIHDEYSFRCIIDIRENSNYTDLELSILFPEEILV